MKWRKKCVESRSGETAILGDQRKSGAILLHMRVVLLRCGRSESVRCEPKAGTSKRFDKKDKRWRQGEYGGADPGHHDKHCLNVRIMSGRFLSRQTAITINRGRAARGPFLPASPLHPQLAARPFADPANQVGRHRLQDSASPGRPVAAAVRSG